MPSPIEKSNLGKIPALRLSALFLAGILIAHWTHLPLILSVFILSAFLAVSLRVKRARNSLLIFIMVVAGIFSYESRRLTVPSITRMVNRWVTIDGVISSEPEITDERLRFELNPRKVYSNGTGHKIGGNVLVRSPPADLDYGDRIRIRGFLFLPLPRRNPGEFDYKTYLKRQGIYSILNCKTPDSIILLSSGNGNPFIRRVILPLKRFLKESYSKTLSGETRAFLEGITLGEKEELSANTRELFAKAGIYHILAVSGLHVGIVAFIVFTLLGALRTPRRLIVPMVIGMLIVYMFIADLRPSVVRATIMMSVLLLGLSLERNVNLLNLLGVALLIILLLDPQSPFDLSFQLSFAATGSIIVVLNRFRIPKRNFLHKWLYLPILISLAAQMGTAPIIAYHFFKLPLLTTFANLAVIPSVTASIALGFISSLITPISLEVSRIFAAANWLIIQCVLKLIRIVGSFKYSEIIIGRPSIQFLFAYLLLFGLALNLKRMWVRKALIFAILITANLFIWQKALARVPLRMTFLSVDGSASIVETPAHRTILILDGDRMDYAERVIERALWEKGIRKIELLVLTRPGCSKNLGFLFQDFKIRRLITPLIPHGSKEYIQTLELSRKYNSEYLGVIDGDRLVLDGVRLTFHYPTSSLMEFASVFELNYEHFSLLWWGEGVHGGSRLKLHKMYDMVKCGPKMAPTIGANMMVCEGPRDRVDHSPDNLVFTNHGAVSIASDGDTFWAEQVFHRPDRVSQ